VSQKAQDLDKQKAELEAKKAKIHQAELRIAEMKKQLNDTQVELQKSSTSPQSNATLSIPSIAKTPAVPVVASAIVQNNTNNGTVSAA
jgi:chromosome segregation ATPase